MRVLVGTHAFHLHLIEFDTSSRSITKLNDIKLREQPSYTLQHHIHKDLFYVTAWVESIIYVVRIDKLKGSFEVLGQAQSGGGGPTHFVLSPEGESLIIANYRSGEVTRLGVDPSTGLFVSDTAAFEDVLALPFSAPSPDERSHRLKDRQSSSHPHQVVTIPRRLPSDPQTYLVPDLGGDAVFVVEYSQETKWTIWNRTNSKPGWGPRHAIVNTVNGTSYLYLVNELVNKVTIHRISFDSTTGKPRIEDPTQAYSTLPASLAESYVPEEPYESIACTILLHTTPDGIEQVIVTNRNAKEDIRPEGDSIVVFPVSADGVRFEEEVQHLVGAGRHLRAAAVTTAADGTAYLMVGARNGNGLTVYSQGKGDNGVWQEVLKGVQVEGIDLPISINWL
ncbi:hypothetical protein NCC49_005064 [Naganishia albida]|nr:hypothetical protein NCC49_005064 [Naganishia albida]